MNHDVQVQAHQRLLTELEQRNRAFNTLVDLLGEVVFSCRDNGDITFVNTAWQRNLGYDIVDTINQDLSGFLVDPQQQKWLKNALENDVELSSEVQMKTASSKSALVIIRAKKRDGLWYGSLYDLSTQQLILKQRAESENQVRKLSWVAERTDNMVVITDDKGMIDWVNDGFERVTGYTLAEIKGLFPGVILQGPQTLPEAVAHMREQIRKNESFHVELVNYTKSGKPYWTAIDSSPVFDDAGELINFIAIQRDITAQKNQEKALKEAKRNAEDLSEARTLFVANMSHEIRTPLNSILGMSSVLANTSLNAEQKSCIETISNGGKALLALVDDVLDFAKMESGQMQYEKVPFSSSLIFEEAIDIVAASARDKSLELFLRLDGAIPNTLIGDPNRLRQVLLNLLSNAIKFTSGGSVTVIVEWKTISHNNGVISVQVIDTGVGIAKSRQANLFEQFSQLDASITRQHGGTGLGLAICRQICEQLGGKIEVHSKVNHGSIFTASIPFNADPTTTETKPPVGVLIDGLHSKHLSPILQTVASQHHLTYDNNSHVHKIVVSDDNGERTANLKMLDSIYTPNRVAKILDLSLSESNKTHQHEEKESLDRLGQLRVLVAEDVVPNQLVLRSMLQQLGIKEITIVNNGADALTELRDREPGYYNVFFLDIHMPVLDGLSTAASLSPDEKNQLKLIALSADVSPEAKEIAFSQGIDRWLSKPIVSKV